MLYILYIKWCVCGCGAGLGTVHAHVWYREETGLQDVLHKLSDSGSEDKLEVKVEIECSREDEMYCKCLHVIFFNVEEMITLHFGTNSKQLNE